jgi:hypothetical protein
MIQDFVVRVSLELQGVDPQQPRGFHLDVESVYPQRLRENLSAVKLYTLKG